MVHGFYNKIVAVLCHQKPVTDSAYALVVGTVGDGCIAVEPFGESSSGGFCWMYFIAVFAA